MQMEDGSAVPRTAGTPQGGVISPLLANLRPFLGFD
jgi:RNA-directed DNA polymerase